MRVSISFVVVTVLLIVPSWCKPAWPRLFLSNYRYPAEAISAEPQYLQFSAYQDAYSPYYVYNVLRIHDLRESSALLTNGKPMISSVPVYNHYYGTPIYDFRFPLNPVYSVLTPSRPGLLPRPTVPSSTEEPFDDDTIEKLDTKIDPDTEMKPSGSKENTDDDSISVEAI